MKKQLYDLIRKFFALTLTLFLFCLLVFSLFHFQLLLPNQDKPNLTNQEISNIVNQASQESDNNLPTEEGIVGKNDYLNDQKKETEPLENEVLSVSGIVNLTNSERLKNNLSRLENNQKLNLIAEKKARDIIEKKYFAHVSPTGEAIGDLAKKNNYDYILIGENLARGNFKDNKEIVQGWMDSPPHRKNILKESFTEIGVAAERGVYKGQSVWVGVQVFATSSSICPEINNSLLVQIEESKEVMDNLTTELETLKDEISETNNSEDYNQKVDRYNKLVNMYNDLRENLESSINTYNNQVEERNICFDNYK